MSLKKILVPLSGFDTDSLAMDTALILARDFEAHVEALCPVPTDDDFPSRHPKVEDSDTFGIGLVDRTEGARLFLSCCEVYQIKEWQLERQLAIGLPGVEADLIAKCGRISDLTVFAHLNSTDGSRPNVSLQAALRETGRPILLTTSTDSRVGKRNVIAWNGITGDRSHRRICITGPSTREWHSSGHNRQSLGSAVK